MRNKIIITIGILASMVMFGCKKEKGATPTPAVTAPTSHIVKVNIISCVYDPSGYFLFQPSGPNDTAYVACEMTNGSVNKKAYNINSLSDTIPTGGVINICIFTQLLAKLNANITIDGLIVWSVNDTLAHPTGTIAGVKIYNKNF